MLKSVFNLIISVRLCVFLPFNLTANIREKLFAPVLLTLDNGKLVCTIFEIC